MNGEIWFQLPPNEPRDWIIVTVAAIIAVTFAVYRGMPRDKDHGDPLANLQARLGLLSLAEGPFVIAILMWAVLVASLFGGLIFTLYDAVRALGIGGDDLLVSIRASAVTLTAITATLGAAVALPIKLMSMQHTARQTSVAEESLFNDKINDASKDLAAWREVTEVVVGKDGHKHVLTTREPDLVTRATAIDRLYGLIKERPSEASRIAAMLATYIVGTTGNRTSTVADWPAKQPTSCENFSWYVWIDDELPEPRSDIQRAVTVLCQINSISDFNKFDTPISLAGANLQKVSFVGLTISNVDFSSSHFHGARVKDAVFKNCRFYKSEWQGTVVEDAVFETCDFSNVNFEHAQFFSSAFYGSDFKNTDWRVHNLSSCKFSVCQFDEGFKFSDPINDPSHHTALQRMLPYGCIFPGSLIFNPSEELCNSLRDQFDSVFCRIFNVDFQVRNQPKHWITPADSRVNQPEVVRQIWRAWVAENHPDVLQYLPDHVRNA